MSETARRRMTPRTPVFGAAVVRCPGCGSSGMERVDGGYSIDYLCRDCGDVWHSELGYVRRVRKGPLPPVATAPASRVSAS